MTLTTTGLDVVEAEELSPMVAMKLARVYVSPLTVDKYKVSLNIEAAVCTCKCSYRHLCARQDTPYYVGDARPTLNPEIGGVNGLVRVTVGPFKYWA